MYSTHFQLCQSKIKVTRMTYTVCFLNCLWFWYMFLLNPFSPIRCLPHLYIIRVWNLYFSQAILRSRPHGKVKGLGFHIVLNPCLHSFLILYFKFGSNNNFMIICQTNFLVVSFRWNHVTRSETRIFILITLKWYTAHKILTYKDETISSHLATCMQCFVPETFFNCMWNKLILQNQEWQKF